MLTLLRKSSQKPVNYWRNDRCARAFWKQHELPAYRQLLEDTIRSLRITANSNWLDLGCGAGRLSLGLWNRSAGEIREIIGMDCAAVNANAFAKLQHQFAQTSQTKVIFQHRDFSDGLGSDYHDYFDGIVSGLAIQYAEHYCPQTNKWTDKAYDFLLAEVYRSLKRHGQFVFSVNVPEPSWGAVALSTLRQLPIQKNRLRSLQRLYRMYRYGGWLKKQARQGRFHYLPAETIKEKLARIGFKNIDFQISFANQAFIFSCEKG